MGFRRVRKNYKAYNETPTLIGNPMSINPSDIYTGSAAQEFVKNTNKTINRINRRKAIAKAMIVSGRIMTASAVVLGVVAAVKIAKEHNSED